MRHEYICAMQNTSVAKTKNFPKDTLVYQWITYRIMGDSQMDITISQKLFVVPTGQSPNLPFFTNYAGWLVCQLKTSQGHLWRQNFNWGNCL